MLLSFSVFKSLGLQKKGNKQGEPFDWAAAWLILISQQTQHPFSPTDMPAAVTLLLMLQLFACFTSLVTEPLPTADECAGSAIAPGRSSQGNI